MHTMTKKIESGRTSIAAVTDANVLQYMVAIALKDLRKDSCEADWNPELHQASARLRLQRSWG